MSVKIRLARKGRTKLAYYHIVVADSRSPRDGRFIEKIGIYNPLTDPATIDVNFEKALGWLHKGAQPTDTCRAILKYKGVMMKKHLLEGVKKGAFDEAEADRRFNEWLKGKDEKIELKKSGLEKKGEETRKQRLEAETTVKETRAAAYAKKLAAIAAAAEAAAKAAAAPEASAEVAVEPKAEVAVETAAEPVADAVAETEVEVKAEVESEPVAETQAEAPAPEAKEETAEEKEKTE